eukprot:6171859-Pleurochrysis_carterae.AAC.1
MLPPTAQTIRAMAADAPAAMRLGGVSDCPTRIDGNGYLTEDFLGSTYGLAWVQPPISSVTDDTYKYSSVVISTKTVSVTVSLNDFVYVTPDRDGPVEIGQVISLYDAGPDEDNAMYFSVRWLYRKEHIEEDEPDPADENPAAPMKDRELLYSTHIDECAVEAIEWYARHTLAKHALHSKHPVATWHGLTVFLAACVIRKVNVLLYQDEKQAGNQIEQPHTFFCYRAYDTKTEKITALKPPARPTQSTAQPRRSVSSRAAPARATVPAPALQPLPSSDARCAAPSPGDAHTELTEAFADVPASCVLGAETTSAPPCSAPLPTAGGARVAAHHSTDSSEEADGKRRRKSTLSVSYDDFAALETQVQELRTQLALQAHLVKQLIGVDMRVARLEEMTQCASSAGSGSSVRSLPSATSGTSTSS